MIEIEVLINTNGGESNPKLEIENICNFTTKGMADNTYDAKVSFQCFPRAVDPDFVQFILKLKDIGEDLIVWGPVCVEIVKFIKRIKNGTFLMCLKKDKENKGDIEISNEITAEELESKIKKQLEE